MVKFEGLADRRKDCHQTNIGLLGLVPYPQPIKYTRRLGLFTHCASRGTPTPTTMVKFASLAYRRKDYHQSNIGLLGFVAHPNLLYLALKSKHCFVLPTVIPQ